MLTTIEMQIVATVLVWENCWYFMPSVADEDPILRVSSLLSVCLVHPVSCLPSVSTPWCKP